MANNKEMKTLGGYEIVDQKAREDIEILQNKEDSTKELEEKVDEALSLAKGATRAFVYDTYSDMISGLNKLPKTELQVNYHVMIREVCVPDLWVSGISDEHVEYTYTSNEDFIVDLTEDGVVQVGYFVLSALETQKVDLSEYVKNTDYAFNKVGVVKIQNVSSGLQVNPNSGEVSLARAPKGVIDEKSNDYRPITPSNLDYAVKKALSDCKLEGDVAWTEEEKAKVLELLGGLQRIASTGSFQRVYAIGQDGVNKPLNTSENPFSSALVLFDAGGCVKVNAPTKDNHATTKKYVDDLIADLQEQIDALKG